MHTYILDDKIYPSVTTIIKTISGNNELMKWANHMGFKRKDITKILKDTSIFGTRVHEFLCAYVDKNATIPQPFKNPLGEYEINKILSNFKKTFIDDYTTIFTEKSIVSKELGYGGTLDWLMKQNTELILCDFKTSKKPRNTMFLQLGAYNNLLKTIGIDVNKGMIITANEFNCFKYPIEKEKLEDYGTAFNLLFYFYREWEVLTQR